MSGNSGNKRPKQLSEGVWETRRTLSRWLVRARYLLGMSRRALGEATGIPAMRIIRIEQMDIAITLEDMLTLQAWIDNALAERGEMLDMDLSVPAKELSSKLPGPRAPAGGTRLDQMRAAKGAWLEWCIRHSARASKVSWHKWFQDHRERYPDISVHEFHRVARVPLWEYRGAGAGRQ